MKFIINLVFCSILSLTVSFKSSEPYTHSAYKTNTHVAPHLTSGNSHAKNGNYAKALAELDQAISLDPSNARGYKLRGHVYYAMGDYARSLRDLDRVVSLIPDSANAYCDRAISNSMVGNHGAALLDVEQALKLKPDSSFAHSAREKILERAQDANLRK